jgi:Flp pilus assembly protein TadB
LTSLLSDGLHIRGLGTWLVATLIVWLVGLLGGLLLPLFVLKKTAERHRKAS